MKKLATTYTFNATAKTITCVDFFLLDAILLITNVNTNTIIYNFAGVGKGGTLSGTTLTLDFNTAGMSNSDPLQIFVEDLISPANNDVMILLQNLVHKLNQDQSQSTDGSKRATIVNALTLLGFQIPSGSTNPNIWGFVADQSRVAVATNVITNIR